MSAHARLMIAMSSVLLLVSRATMAKEFVDPAPPEAAALSPAAPAEPRKNDDVTFHAAPKPLPAGAATSDWPHFLGPDHNNVSRETKLLPSFDAKGPPLVWEMARGSGYAAPAVAGDRLVLFHRVGDEEVVDCLHAETGQRYWRFAYPTAYQDRYGYSDGPRGSPVVSKALDSVFAYGAEGKLHCVELSTGRLRWRRDLSKEFKLKQNFFGVGSSPLLEGDKLIVNVGVEPGGPCIVALDARTGKLAWGAGEQWGPSYATPVPATLHGERRVLVFAGGESDPPTGGLLAIDPANGRVAFTFPWRGTRRESVNASSPLVLGDEIFISESYGSGGAMLKANPDGTIAKGWSSDAFGTHFMTAVEKDGHLYGVDGHGPHDAFLVCVERATGREVWRTQPEWKETVVGRAGAERSITMGTYRCWLTPVDGGARFLCLGEFGHLLWVELSPSGYKELSRARLFSAGETWTPPTISRGLLYVCQNAPGGREGAASTPRLLCYDLRAGEK